MDAVGLVIAIIVLVIGWMIVSVPLWLAARLVTHRKVSLFSAMLGMLLGGLVFFTVYSLTFIITNVFVQSIWAIALSAVFAFLAFLAIFKALFKTNWIGALGIAIVAVILAIIILLVLGAVLVALGIALLAL